MGETHRRYSAWRFPRLALPTGILTALESLRIVFLLRGAPTIGVCLNVSEHSLYATCDIASADATGLSWSRPGGGLLLFSSSGIESIIRSRPRSVQRRRNLTWLSFGDFCACVFRRQFSRLRTEPDAAVTCLNSCVALTKTDFCSLCLASMCYTTDAFSASPHLFEARPTTEWLVAAVALTICS